MSEGKRPKGGGPIIFDGAVKLPQKIDEKAFVNSIELRIWDKVSKISWRPFEEAREYVQSLSLGSTRGWYNFSKSAHRPRDIPVAADRIYKTEGWKNWGDLPPQSEQRCGIAGNGVSH